MQFTAEAGWFWLRTLWACLNRKGLAAEAAALAAVEVDVQAEAAELAGAVELEGPGARAALEEQAAKGVREEPEVLEEQAGPAAKAALAEQPEEDGGTTGRTGGGVVNPNNPNSIYTQPRTIVPQFPPSASTNQQILAALADGTGGFTIFNTNDLLGGLEKIGREQSEFYILGYVPQQSADGSCHTLKVKMNRGGLNVRSRSGYCNTKSTNVLEGTPVEKQLEARATGTQGGTMQGAFEVPYFYTAPNVARVNLAMEIPSNTVQFNKDKGKYHASLNVLGIAYKPDGSIGAKFSDTVNLDLEKDEMKDFTKQPYFYQNQFDAGSGDYKLTVVVSSGGDAFGKYESKLQIDPYDGKQFSLGGVVLTNSLQKLSDIPTGLDSALLEDRTPLVVQGNAVQSIGQQSVQEDG